MQQINTYNDIIKILDNYLKNSSLDRINIGLSGGRSFTNFYPVFIKYLKSLDKNIASRLYFSLVDERMVDIGDNDRSITQIFSSFFDEIILSHTIKRSQIDIIDFSHKDYLEIQNQKIPKFHIAFFGSGEDGHIASLFPNHKLLSSLDDGFVEIDDSPKPPLRRITISPNMISNIDIAILFFIGIGKKSAYIDFLDNSISEYDIPAKLLNNAGNLYVYSDIT